MQIYDIPLDAGQREITRPGTPDFPLAIYYSVLSQNVLGYTPLHWNEELQFCLVVRGQGLFFVNEERFVLSKGEGLFINSGYLHMARPVKDPDSSYICLDIAPQLLSGFAGSVMEQKYLLPALADPTLVYQVLQRQVPWERELLDQIEQVYQLSEDKPEAYELLILSRLYVLVAGILAHRTARQNGLRRTHANGAIQKMLSYMAAHYGEKVTLAELSDYASYTESECCRIFKRFTGESIFSYLRNFRLEQSIPRLLNTDEPISDIAYGCGFSSTSYYIDIFKKQFGITPLQYRKNPPEAQLVTVSGHKENPGKGPGTGEKAPSPAAAAPKEEV